MKGSEAIRYEADLLGLKAERLRVEDPEDRELWVYGIPQP